MLLLSREDLLKSIQDRSSYIGPLLTWSQFTYRSVNLKNRLSIQNLSHSRKQKPWWRLLDLSFDPQQRGKPCCCFHSGSWIVISNDTLWHLTYDLFLDLTSFSNLLRAKEVESQFLKPKEEPVEPSIGEKDITEMETLPAETSLQQYPGWPSKF